MRLIHTCLLALALSSLCLAAKPNIAVMELGGNNVDPSDLAGLTNRLRSELFKIGAYTVLERSEMDEVLKEQGFQQTGCVAAECAVQAGQVMGVEKMVVGSVDKVGKTYSATLRMVDVATGRIDKTATADCNNCIIDDVLLTTMRDAARILAGLEKEKRTPSAEPEPMDSAQAAAAWNGKWSGSLTSQGASVRTVPICFDITARNGTLTGLWLDCKGRDKPDTLAGTVSGVEMRFHLVKRVLVRGVSTSDFAGTLRPGAIAGTYTTTFAQRTHVVASGGGTWTVTRKQ
jgi:hypothetical protein